MAGPTRLPHNIKNAKVLAAGPAEMFIAQYQDHARSTQILMGFRSDKEGTWFMIPRDFSSACEILATPFAKQLEKNLSKPGWDRVKSLERKIASLERRIRELEENEES